MRTSSQVIRLVDRIRTLVSERRALEGSGQPDRVEAKRREIERLQWRLAYVVRSELGESVAPRSHSFTIGR